MLSAYEFQCRKCHKVRTLALDPDADDVWHPECECGGTTDRTPNSFASIGHIEQPNGPDGFNLGLGRHFKSVAERDDYAKRNGFEKIG